MNNSNPNSLDLTKTWLFIDFDNTLMATEQHALPSLIGRFNSLYGDKIKHPLTLEEFKQHFHGQAREILCENLSRHFNIDVDYTALYDNREARIMQYMRELPNGITMAPFVIDVLTALKNQGVHLALVSNNPIQRALCAMRFAENKQGAKLAALFETNYFEAGPIQKPKPDVYLQAMSQVNAIPENSFAIEDSVTGATSAIEANLRTFGFTGFAEDKNMTSYQLLKKGCVATFESWENFAELLLFKP